VRIETEEALVISERISALRKTEAEARQTALVAEREAHAVTKVRLGNSETRNERLERKVKSANQRTRLAFVGGVIATAAVLLLK
jgi:hypothetical protein